MFADREAEEAGDAMAALENRTADSQIEMDILDALDDSKLLNARHQKARPPPPPLLPYCCPYPCPYCTLLVSYSTLSCTAWRVAPWRPSACTWACPHGMLRSRSLSVT